MHARRTLHGPLRLRRVVSQVGHQNVSLELKCDQGLVPSESTRAASLASTISPWLLSILPVPQLVSLHCTLLGYPMYMPQSSNVLMRTRVIGLTLAPVLYDLTLTTYSCKGTTYKEIC